MTRHFRRTVSVLGRASNLAPADTQGRKPPSVIASDRRFSPERSMKEILGKQLGL
jgi:hypothetical protein